MAFDLGSLRRAVAEHGRVARVVVADSAGSAPREVGAAMLVWPGGQSGTIGGGALEHRAAAQALTRTGLSRHPLGPELGQCCGGSVTLLTEHFDAAALAGLSDREVIARGPGEMPLSVRRLLDEMRARGALPAPRLIGDWMIEPLAIASRPLWIWGAGHVGRAIVAVLSPLPGFAITWIDTASDRFPAPAPDGVTILPAANPVRLVAHAPRDAAHLVLTYSHALDLALCDALLLRGFASAGLIGSDTKWRRFRKRLAAMGHGAAQIDRIFCPIGEKRLGKAPQAIAIGVAAALLRNHNRDGDTCTTRFSASGG